MHCLSWKMNDEGEDDGLAFPFPKKWNGGPSKTSVAVAMWQRMWRYPVSRAHTTTWPLFAYGPWGKAEPNKFTVSNFQTISHKLCRLAIPEIRYKGLGLLLIASEVQIGSSMWEKLNLKYMQQRVEERLLGTVRTTESKGSVGSVQSDDGIMT